ncbi:MAG: hypothetical protein MUF84_03710 [Anaerolineae bacterium]|jgi:hypothetical protein|nr:hypothetical protein [Anaerolineae bacterium]
MGRLVPATQGESPVQKHRVLAANDLQYVDGLLMTLGNPNNYLNQDGLDVMSVSEARIAPWAFTGLPTSRVNEVVLVRERLQFLIFPDDSAVEQFRAAPHTETVMVNLGIAVVRGNAPFLSDARLMNFLDFWKGLFFPVTDARVHFLSTCTSDLPSQARLIYINRRMVQSYSHA